MSDIKSQIKANLENIKSAIHKQAQLFGRAEEDINLVAVSKVQPTERVQAMLDCGHRLYGENRVQEAQGRWGDLKKQYPDIKLHLIGPLQTNKVKDAVSLFDVIETVDREKLAASLAKEMKKQNKNIPCFIQVNTGGEEQKAGIAPKELKNFLSFCRGEGLSILGLMCIPPVDDPPALHFAFLKKLAAENNLKDLSMGMSSDFEKAIPLGATYVRVGTALFGVRE
ncbi:MAG TPA: YggS family pyridoxal phosphate-dependent enzyme [Alphaproteobacteria bacterium]|nr:YggS family pyridoxal phosphate-dependent enzyme [Alphaproteobacteria bacterium]